MSEEQTPINRARVQRPERLQMEWRTFALDQFLPADHRARVVWRFVESLDLSDLYAKIQSVEGKAGRDAVDPKILMALWLFATLESVSSARQIARLCERDLAYMWVCGGVGVNYHLLSDFRTAHGEVLNQLLTNTVATLMHQGLVTLETVAQDGVRVRANAGSSTFRRKKTLEKCLEEAKAHVTAMQEESQNDPDQNASNARRKAAQERAANEREERIGKAVEEVVKLQEQKEKRRKGTGEDARCSTTDPEARTMKMGDGGYRPAYNVQLATDGDSRVIVGVEVTNECNDSEQMAPMQAQVSNRFGKVPINYLVDCGFPTHDQVTKTENNGSRVHAPLYGEEKMRSKGVDPHARQRRDTDESFAFRQRMATEEAKELYKKRPSIAEFANAEFRNRGLTQFRVRGLTKVKAVCLWHAIAFNLIRMIGLGCAA